MDIALEAPTLPIRPIARVVRSLVVGALAVPLTVYGGMSALASSGEEDAFTAGTIGITSTATGPAFSLPSLAPGQTVVRRVTVTADGSLPASVRMFATVRDEGLARFLIVTVTREGSPAEPVYRGRLSAFPRAWDEAADDGHVWLPGERHAYRIEITLVDDAPASARSAGVDFHWRAQAA